MKQSIKKSDVQSSSLPVKKAVLESLDESGKQQVKSYSHASVPVRDNNEEEKLPEKTLPAREV